MDFSSIIAAYPSLLQGMWVTLKLLTFAVVGGIVLVNLPTGK